MKKLVLICLFILTACAGPQSRYYKVDPGLAAEEARKQKEIAITDFWQDNLRVQRVAYPIKTNNWQYCGDAVVPTAGMYLANFHLFSKNLRDTTADVVGMDEHLRVAQIYQNSPAHKQGLRVGDRIIEINGTPIPSNAKAMVTATRLANEQHLTNNHVTYTIKRNGQQLNYTINPLPICNFPIFLSGKQEINAYADGEKMVVYRGLTRFFPQDENLALILSHELAHNAMRHIDALQQNAMVGGLLGATVDILASSAGVGTGGRFSQAGAQMGAMRYSQDFEREADYIGLYFMARAGYNISEAANVWRRMATLSPQGISIAKTHPTTAERFIGLEQTIAEIQSKKANNIPLTPEMTGGS